MDTTLGGPSLAFPLNAGAPLRDGFLAFVCERKLRLDFFSFLWFTDATRDPLDFRVVAQELRSLLDSQGLVGTRLMLSYWNHLAVPTNSAPSHEKGAFQAAAIYLQDSLVDDAFFFHADSGKDPHYGFVDPTAIYSNGAPDAQALAFALIGRAMRGESGRPCRAQTSRGSRAWPGSTATSPASSSPTSWHLRHRSSPARATNSVSAFRSARGASSSASGFRRSAPGWHRRMSLLEITVQPSR